MKDKEINYLLNKLKSGTCSAEEEMKVKLWLHQLNQDSDIDVSDDELLQVREEMWGFIKDNRQTVAQSTRLWRQIAAAAAILLFLSIGGYLYQNQEAEAPVSASRFVKNDISPGGNKAYLTLADGSIVDLNDDKDGLIIGENKLTYNDGSLIETSANSTSISFIPISPSVILAETESSQNSPQHLTITIPKGGQYQVTLVDGTKVWLNSASTFTYPTRFTGSERRVELSGEGYFEVTSLKKPFIVTSAGQEVKVLGTHFNIKAYNDEGTTKTTLLEGSVQVSAVTRLSDPSSIMNRHGQNILLKPGEQSILTANNLKVIPVDVEEIVDWKNGDFVFKNDNLESILRKVARWYDVEIEYAEDAPKDIALWGYVSRSNNISAVLNQIERTGKVYFTVEGRNIKVFKNK